MATLEQQLDDMSLGEQTCPFTKDSTAPMPSGHPQLHSIRISPASSLNTMTDDMDTPVSPGSAHSDNTVGSSNILFGAAEAKCPVISMQEIDEDLLRTDLEARVAYLSDFIDFSSHDSDIISELSPLVNDAIPPMVDGMYAKLFEFDITKQKFMTRNQGFTGPIPQKLEDLTLTSAQITFRKVFMKSWARRVIASDYSSDKTWAYMDKVGIMHTGKSPFKHQRTMGIAPLNVPYRDCALMLGWVQTVIQTAILQLPESKVSMEKKIAGVAAISKVIWIQNDLFSRHYVKE